ncbi:MULTISPECIES: VirB4-like conjugal transfer ATPase, CD1110 family [Lactococcus]|uniref:VirB4-like conjugal transfer ATPase, CD1110 family n=1 Tax=Lactococcus TaxID=1357 RepID=UPI0009C18333|nr:DUF87 domain-containing protein [Lactococcus lactis]MDS1012917.1 DUF87 domain-containing protein [Lactococcus lactis]TKD78638.1 DUF87 domain-containing protein [Lactococcus lactis]UXV69008.1 DUF87 domain-containing protein [Lactococcus lactis subsp. lactis]
MNLLKKTTLAKRETSSLAKRRTARSKKKANPNSMHRIKYTSQFENGLMHVVGQESSKMYRLGELNYEISDGGTQDNTVISYVEALNTLNQNSRYQLYITNRKVKASSLEHVLHDYQGDENDSLRLEMNTVIQRQQKTDPKNFTATKYAIFTTKARTLAIANHELDKLNTNFINRFDAKDVKLTSQPLTGIERLEVMNDLLRPNHPFTASYQDIALSNLPSKAFIVPSHLKFPNGADFFRVGKRYARVFYVREFPKYLEDKLIKELCGAGIELDISLHAQTYDMVKARKDINTKKTLNRSEIRKQQRKNFKRGFSDDDISGEESEIQYAAEGQLNAFKEEGQKLFSGIFAVYQAADTKEELDKNTETILGIGQTYDVEFEAVEQYNEEALNTILPIGKPYLDVEMNYMRDMTSLNVATQIPWSNINLLSKNGLFYGRNQLTHNMISVNRLKDLITPSGLYLGSSGSGKGMTVKWEMLNVLLKWRKHRLIIVDPESEYLKIAKRFGAEILDISTGTPHHLNILDLVDKSLLKAEDRNVDLIKEKTNLLSSLFDSLLKSFSDAEETMVDRVTRLTYERYSEPTLVEWHKVLLEQPEELAQHFATKIERFTIGSQDIFAHKTNIDLNARFVVFNIKQLDPRLKPFAMKVILDQIWKQVVSGQGKVTTHLYFDELQLMFNDEATAQWFSGLWSRVRKYGTVTNGITQKVGTLLNSEAGRAMITNSEFIVLLRQKIDDINRLREVMTLSPQLVKHVQETAPQGTGLIYAGGTIVPFENPIPKDTALFELMNTDANAA